MSNTTDPRVHLMETFSDEQVNAARQLKRATHNIGIERIGNYGAKTFNLFEETLKNSFELAKDFFCKNNKDSSFKFEPYIEFNAESDGYYDGSYTINLLLYTPYTRWEEDNDVRFRLANDMMKERESEARDLALKKSLEVRLEAAKRRIEEDKETIKNLNEQIKHLSNGDCK